VHGVGLTSAVRSNERSEPPRTSVTARGAPSRTLSITDGPFCATFALDDFSCLQFHSPEQPATSCRQRRESCRNQCFAVNCDDLRQTETSRDFSKASMR
jgi:hypothetical protein